MSSAQNIFVPEDGKGSPQNGVKSSPFILQLSFPCNLWVMNIYVRPTVPTLSYYRS